MGRTNPTYRDLLSRIEDRWQDFRRTLRRRDQPHFDRLFEHASAHADAAGVLNHEDRLAPLSLSIDLEQERSIREMDARIDDLQTRVDDLQTRVDPEPGSDDPEPGSADPHDGPDD